MTEYDIRLLDSVYNKNKNKNVSLYYVLDEFVANKIRYDLNNSKFNHTCNFILILIILVSFLVIYLFLKKKLNYNQLKISLSRIKLYK